MVPALWLVTNPAVQFMIYDRVRAAMSAFARRQRRRVRPIEYFVMAAIAKAAATLVTYPLQITQARLQVDRTGMAANGRRKYRGTIDCLRQLFVADGISGWYHGL